MRTTIIWRFVIDPNRNNFPGWSITEYEWKNNSHIILFISISGRIETISPLLKLWQRNHIPSASSHKTILHSSIDSKFDGGPETSRLNELNSIIFAFNHIDSDSSIFCKFLIYITIREMELFRTRSLRFEHRNPFVQVRWRSCDQRSDRNFHSDESLRISEWMNEGRCCRIQLRMDLNNVFIFLWFYFKWNENLESQKSLRSPRPPFER